MKNNMCGLYGYSTKEGITLTKRQQKLRSRILTSLALAMQERGTHSTGVAGVCSEHQWHIAKQAESATVFTKTPEYQKFVEENPRVVIGHTRFATVGAVTNQNAHPFNIGNIVGAHNGSVSNWKEVFPEGTVDSQAIFHSLNEHNNKFKKALKKVQGRFAVTWFDQRDIDKLYIVRDDNPLSIVRIAELETYFWASLLYPLQAILASHFNLDSTTIWTPKDEYVYTIDGNHKIKKSKIEFGKYIAPNYSSRFNYNDDDDKLWNKAKKDVFDRFDEEDDEEQDILQLTEKSKYTTNYTRLMSLSEQDMRLIDEAGTECGMCQKQVDVVNETLYWHEQEKITLCYECAYQIGEWEKFVYLDEDDLLDVRAEVMFLDEQDAKSERLQIGSEVGK